MQTINRRCTAVALAGRSRVPAGAGFLLRIVLMTGMLTGTASDGYSDNGTVLGRYAADLTFPSAEQPQLVAVRFNQFVYEQAANNYADVRIAETNGDPVPSIRITTREFLPGQQRIETGTVRLVSVHLNEERLQVVAELPKEVTSLHGLSVRTPLKDFEQQVLIERQVEGGAWEEVSREVLFDYTRHLDFRRVRIPLNMANPSLLRLTFAQPTIVQESELQELTRQLDKDAELTSLREQIQLNRKAFRIDAVQWTGRTESKGTGEPVFPEWPAAMRLLNNESRDESTEQRFLISTRRAPVAALDFRSTSTNFRRKARLYQAAADGTPVGDPLSDKHLYKYEVGLLNDADLRLNFPSRRASSYTLIVDNGPNPPIDLSDVRAYGSADGRHDILFIAEPGRIYELRCGGYEEGTNPSDHGLDTGAVNAARQWPDARTVYAEVGEFLPIAGSLAAEAPAAELAWRDRIRQWLNDPLIIGSLSLVAALGLAMALYRAAKRIPHQS